MILDFIYYRIYRAIMKMSHHFNWHYAPRVGPFEDGRTQLWCKWCGLRMTEDNSAGLKDFKLRKLTAL